MGKCCSVDRNELPDENIQIIRMKMPKANKNDFRQSQSPPPPEEMNSNINEKPLNSELLASAIEPQKAVSQKNVKINLEYEQKLEEPNEEINDYEYEEENLNEIPDQEIRKHVFS